MDDPAYWDFAHLRARTGGHALFQYPAMMVPELQGALLDDLTSTHPESSLIYDPFMGSGTVMLECIARGLDFHGSDINPLAVLLSHVKSNPPSRPLAMHLGEEAWANASSSSSTSTFSFPFSEKWFKPSVADALSKLRDAIRAQPNQEHRRYLWICLAETVRLVSNSRTSTFKLHSYDAATLASREPDALKAFRTIARVNAAHVGDHWGRMSEAAMFRDAAPSKVTLLRGSATEPWSAPRQADAIMTSPPYGDNKTTVPYGQHSYLPLCWIDPVDLVGTLPENLLASTAQIDAISLGGSIRNVAQSAGALYERAPSLRSFVESISHKPALEKKVLAFVRDYADALGAASTRLRVGGFSFWTLGQRRVDDKEMPLVAVTREILQSHNQTHVHTVHRNLPLASKRMAGRNSQSATMGTEQILIMQKSQP